MFQENVVNIVDILNEQRYTDSVIKVRGEAVYGIYAILPILFYS